MPELPEVALAASQLERWMGGQAVVALHVLDEAAIRTHRSTLTRDALPGGAARLQAEVVGVGLRGVRRLGKRLAVGFAGEWLLHLGMTGRLTRQAEGLAAPRHGRLGFVLADGQAVWFEDARRFGGISPLPEPALLGLGLGPDAWLAKLDGPALAARLPGRRAIKVGLLDQAALAGLGNIHAVEALWRAGVHPNTPCEALSAEAWQALASGIVAQLGEALVEVQGEAITYVNQGGENCFAVYQRGGLPCPRCGAILIAERQAGRATSYCPSCQRLPS